MKQLIKDRILKNPKTTAKGVVTLALVTVYCCNLISTEQFTVLAGFLASANWILSKDSGTNS